MRKPRFSIVIPTRSRANLLGYAIRSALAQTHDDFEVLVSDNFSTDATAEVIDSFDDARLRSVRTDKPLLMHDSWAFALSRAEGEIITYLCDDDALIPRALELIEHQMQRHEADVAYWRSCSHKSLDWFDHEQRGMFSFGAPFTDRCFEVDTHQLLDDAFDLRITGRGFIPLMLNTAVRREVLERAEKVGTNLFRPSCPDYSSMLALAIHAKHMVMIDAPLLVAGATPQSIGAASLNREEAAKAFIDELLAHEPDLVLPDATVTNVAWIAQTYLQCARDWPALQGRTVNMMHCHALARREIDAHKARGIEVMAIEQEYENVLNQCEDSLRRQVDRFVETRREIESERFLHPVSIQGDVLGIGPCHGGGGCASEWGFETIDQLAAGLENWLADHACSLDGLWTGLRLLAGGCGGRRPVIYGLGQNGRSLLRSLPHDGARFCFHCIAHDDYLDISVPGIERLAGGETLDPELHVVLVTPENPRAIVSRLEGAGFIAGRDWFTPAQATGASLSAIV